MKNLLMCLLGAEPLARSNSGNTTTIVQKLWNYCDILRDEDELFDHYRHTLEKLGAAKGLLGLMIGKMRDNSG